MRDYIPVNKELIPYNFNILLGSTLFNLKINYNKRKDLFTVDVLRENEVICYGEPIVYGLPLFQDIFMVEKYPCLNIIPLDLSGNTNKVTYDNFYNTVFLYIDNEGNSLREGCN